MKTSTLIAILQEKLITHGDIDAEVTWEGISRPIYAESIYKTKDNRLFIDGEGVDLFHYKERFAEDPAESTSVDAPRVPQEDE
jgi:hypothetical protein